MAVSWLDLWARMGPLANSILVVLFLMSVVALEVAIRKWIQLRRFAHATRRFTPQLSQALESGRIQEALRLSEQHQGSPVARVVGEALRTVVPLLERGDSSLVERMADRALDREEILLAAQLKKGLGALATVGATAPFLGLLGTVIGITNSFAALSAAGGGLDVVAGGIGEALITTAIGLVVAIPSIWLFNYFTGRLERLFSELSYAGRELGDWLVLHAEKRRKAVARGSSLDDGDSGSDNREPHA